MEKPTEPFMYIAGRPYSFSEPGGSCSQLESLTEEKGDNIVRHLGESMKILLYKSSRWDRKPLGEYQKGVQRGRDSFVLEPLVSVSAKLEDFAKIRIDRAKEGIMYEVLDWVYMLKYNCEDVYSKMAVRLMKGEGNSFISNEEAYQWQIAFWERNHLNLVVEMTLPDNRGCFSTAADLFEPTSNVPFSSFVISLYSHKPELLQKMYERGYGRKPLSRETPPPDFIFNDGKDEASRLYGIIQKIEQYNEKSGRTGVSEPEIRSILTPLEQAILLPITTEINGLYGKYKYVLDSKRDEEDKYEILSLIDTLRDNYIVAKQACGEDPWEHYFLTESLPKARDFYKNYMGSDREDGLISNHHHYTENFTLIEYSIQERNVKLRNQSNSS